MTTKIAAQIGGFARVIPDLPVAQRDPVDPMQPDARG